MAGSVASQGSLGLEAQAGLFSLAKRQWPLSPRQRLASAPRGGGRRLEPNTAKVSAQYCNRMIVDAAERGDVEEALVRMQKLRSEGLLPNNEAFNALLSELIRCKQLEAAEDWLAKPAVSALDPEMAGLQGSATVYNALVTAFAEGGHLPKAEKYAREMEGKGLQLDGHSYTALIRACLTAGESRRAHLWCTEMADAGFRKPNKAVMKSLICALADAGNTQSASQWLKFMAEEGSDLDVKTYEHLRAAHPVDIVPAGLSGEVGASVPPVIRPATVGAERRLAEAAPALPRPAHQEPARPAWLLTPRRSSGLRLQPIAGTAELQGPSKTGGWIAKGQQPGGSQSHVAVQRWLADMGTGDAWLGRKGMGAMSSTQ